MRNLWSCDRATYLNGCSNAFRLKCCKDSLFGGVCPPLEPLIDEIGQLVVDSSDFCRNAHSHSNRLSFGATGVDNDKGGGYEKRGPVSSVTAMGRLYHFIGDQSSINAFSGLGAHLLTERKQAHLLTERNRQ